MFDKKKAFRWQIETKNERSERVADECVWSFVLQMQNTFLPYDVILMWTLFSEFYWIFLNRERIVYAFYLFRFCHQMP